MRLFELAYTCRLFGELVGVDSATAELESVTRGRIDLDDEAHAKALLVWLNKWGCRQFAIAHHGEAGRMLAEWGDLWLPVLPKPSASLSQLKDRQLEVTADAYADVKDRQASRRVLKDGRGLGGDGRRDGCGQDPPRRAASRASAVGRPDARRPRARRRS